MAPVVQHFLLVFDHALAKLVHEDSFGEDLDAAVAAYSAMEAQHRDHANIDIVLVGSDSIETVRHTHANYFDGSAFLGKNHAVSPYLQGI